MVYFGEIAALITAVCWTCTSLAFESAGKKVGSLSVNFIRLVIAFFLLGTYTYFSRGLIFPTDADFDCWLWLTLSAIVGFMIGDLMLFQAFVVVGARISMLIMASVPPITALMAFFMLGEKLSAASWFGMAVTISGIAVVILQKEGSKEKMKFSTKGVLLAFGGSVGQAAGLVMSKFGMKDYDAFSATQIRVFAGMIGFAFLIFVLKKWAKVFNALKQGKAMRRISIGAFFGPFLGVSFSLLAVQHTTTGVAATIMAVVPVMIIPPAYFIFKEKINFKEILGAVIAVAGVAFMFLK